MKSPLNKILLSFLLLLHCFAFAQILDKDGIPEKTSPPKLLNDFAEIISINERENLEEKLLSFNDTTSIQICIVTVNSIEDYSIEDYAVRLGRKWGVGQKDKDNGILILVAREERKVDIEIGYGLESYITDYDSKHIIDELIIPAFKQSNYYEGIDLATDRIIGLLQGTYESGDYSNSGRENGNSMPTWVIIFLIILVIFIIIMSSSGKSGGGNIGRGGGGWTWSSGGGSSWGGGGSSGGFGGFGGGSFGGGGSSGSW